MSRLTGGCACGAVRYSIDAEPTFSFHCQCRQCQRATGTGHASLFIVPKVAVSVTGDLTYYDQTADDGATVSRGFCPRCGSPMLGNTTGHPDIVLITAASLDDPTQFKPQKLVFSKTGQPWDYIDPALRDE
ncbi:MAG: GFA family protein [Gammaproteobacteria bacterium]|nr:GFA family protein [Gammaproteobacteria bacterium]